jgi:hypothetical protein
MSKMPMTTAARRTAELKAHSRASLDRIEADIAVIQRSLDVVEARLVGLTLWKKACSLLERKARHHA